MNRLKKAETEAMYSIGEGTVVPNCVTTPILASQVGKITNHVKVPGFAHVTALTRVKVKDSRKLLGYGIIWGVLIPPILRLKDTPLILLFLAILSLLFLLFLSPFIVPYYVDNSIDDRTGTIKGQVDGDAKESVGNEESKVVFEPNSTVGRLPRNSNEVEQVELALLVANAVGKLAHESAKRLAAYAIGIGLRRHFPLCRLIRSANSHQRERALTITNDTQLNLLSCTANESFIRVSDNKITVQEEPIQKIVTEIVNDYASATLRKLVLNRASKTDKRIGISVKWEFTDEEFIELCRYWMSEIEGYEDLTEDEKDKVLSNFNEEHRLFTKTWVDYVRKFAKPIEFYSSPKVVTSPNIVTKEPNLFSRLLDTLWPSSQQQKPSQRIIY